MNLSAEVNAKLIVLRRSDVHDQRDAHVVKNVEKANDYTCFLAKINCRIRFATLFDRRLLWVFVDS